MIMFAELRNFEKCIIVDGVSYLFDMGGNCIREDCGLSPMYTSNARLVNAVSLLSVGGQLSEIGIEQNNVMTKWVASISTMDILSLISQNRGFIGIFNRRGSVDGVAYTQSVVLFEQNINVVNYLRNIGVVMEESR